jgi:photosystem II stability/assembly factor-like uncharacterized protein
MQEPLLRKVRRRPAPGGKALARLYQFGMERGLFKKGAKSVGKPGAPAVRTFEEMRAQHNADGKLASLYLEAFEQIRRVEEKMPVVPIPQGWRPLGPFCVPHGQTYGAGPGSRPAVAGRVPAIAVDPGNPLHLLIGAGNGGVWETNDRGGHWYPRTDDQPTLATGAVTFDPSNPTIAYAGTGEGDSFSSLGVGLLRSTDGGATWSLRCTHPFVGNGFYEIVVDPLDGDHLLAATTVGLYESTDAGVNWRQCRSRPTFDLSMHPVVGGDPNSTKEVFASCDDGVYRSTDGGTTWAKQTLPGAPASFDRVELCHAPSDGNVAYIFAGSGKIVYIWRREIIGGAFTRQPTPPRLRTSQAWYNWCAAVAPNNPDALYVGGIDLYKGIRSMTGTWTWACLSAKKTGDSIHPDQHHITFSPFDPNVIYTGNDGGIYMSPDAGNGWISLNKGLCITEFGYLAAHPQYDAWLIGGTQDNGTLRYEGEESWFQIADGDGGDCGINTSTPYTCYHTYYYMGIERSTTGGGWGSWKGIGPNSHESSLFYPPLDCNGDLVVQAGTKVHLSRDTGTRWSKVALPARKVASALCVPTETRVYVGTTTGEIYRIDRSRSSWRVPMTLTKPRTGWVSDLMVDPSNSHRIWATYTTLGGGHVFRSDDAGTTWSDTTRGLPDIPVNAIEIDPTNGNHAWIAADVGVYRTTNAGASWTPFNNRLPNALAKDVLLHKPTRMLRVALQSRGVWEINVDQASVRDVELYVRDSVVDTGRLSPPSSGVPDPFNFGSITHWHECPDLKADSPTYQTVSLSDVDFELFQDDHGVFASGLQHENTMRSRVVRVFVQIHNRGLNPATNVKVKCFFADASIGLPDLPSDFWINFLNNTLPVGSPWRAIGPYKTVPQVDAGRTEIIGFDWPVPVNTAPHTSLLAIITADNDELVTGESSIWGLVTQNKKCGLKNLALVDPPAFIGPRIRALKLNVWGSQRFGHYSLGIDRAPRGMVEAMLFSRHLSDVARRDAVLKRIKPTESMKKEVMKVLEGSGALDQIDLEFAFVPNPRRPGIWLKDFDLDRGTPQTVVVVTVAKLEQGRWSLLLWNGEGTEVGGFTLQSNAAKAIAQFPTIEARQAHDLEIEEVGRKAAATLRGLAVAGGIARSS